MKWIGLTGGIATGKSTVARLLEGLGFPVIDADQISHRLTRRGEEGYLKVTQEFKNIVGADLEIDRKKLAEIIFNNSSEKQKLESILHPLIQKEVQRLRQTYQLSGQLVCFYDIPLLFEKNLKSQFDQVIVVWCDPQIQLERFIFRSKVSKDEALIRIKAQLPMSEKICQATYCIDNSGSESVLISLVNNLSKMI